MSNRLIFLVAMIAIAVVLTYAYSARLKERYLLEQPKAARESIYDRITVTRVIDADTLELENGEHVRLIGIDAPEIIPNEKAFNKAKKTGQDIETIVKNGKAVQRFIKSLVEEKEVQLEFDVERRDSYSRLLAYVWYEICPESHSKDMDIPENFQTGYRKNIQGYDGTFVFLNATIIKSGYALPFISGPNVKYASFLEKLHEEAEQKNRGLWSKGRGVPSGPETEAFFDEVEKLLQMQPPGEPMSVADSEEDRQEGDSCSFDGACAGIDCSKYDTPVKEGYIPLCVKKRCKCMCPGCE
ncbi:thermonuclease family protein [Candidatus Omnitrophota bacterium]